MKMPDLNVSDMMSKHYIIVRVKGVRWLTLRINLALLLFRFGAYVAGIGFKVNIDGRN